MATTSRNLRGHRGLHPGGRQEGSHDEAIIAIAHSYASLEPGWGDQGTARTGPGAHHAAPLGHYDGRVWHNSEEEAPAELDERTGRLQVQAKTWYV